MLIVADDQLPQSDAPPTSWWPRFGLRFALAYFALYWLPYPVTGLPKTDWIADPIAAMWDWVSAVVGRHVLGRELVITPMNGSGDTTANYVFVGVIVVLALATAVVWTTLARRPRNDRRLFVGLHIYLRWGLALVLISYGLAKVLPTQFGPPTPTQLWKTYGDSSPMNLLWTFMGASVPYTIFSGAAELVAGVLLLFRRTATLGALLATAVMTNVVMLNLCYDVPVKQFSAHLLLTALFLLIPFARRLFDAVVLGRAVGPAAELAFAWSTRRRRIIARVAKWAVLLPILYLEITGAWSMFGRYGPHVEHAPLYGNYEVARFVRDGAVVPPLATDAERWNRVAITDWGLTLWAVNGQRSWFRIDYDADRNHLVLLDETTAVPVSIDVADDGSLELRGDIDGHALEVSLRYVPRSEFLLVSRGFHWINEYPFNR